MRARALAPGRAPQTPPACGLGPAGARPGATKGAARARAPRPVLRRPRTHHGTPTDAPSPSPPPPPPAPPARPGPQPGGPGLLGPRRRAGGRGVRRGHRAGRPRRDAGAQGGARRRRRGLRAGLGRARGAGPRLRGRDACDGRFTGALSPGMTQRMSRQAAVLSDARAASMAHNPGAAAPLHAPTPPQASPVHPFVNANPTACARAPPAPSPQARPRTSRAPAPMRQRSRAPRWRQTLPP
jgi:hypothetical protein